MIGDAIGSTAIAGTVGGTVPPAISVFINGKNLTDNLFTGAGGEPVIQVSDVVSGTSIAQFVLVEPESPAGSSLDVQLGHEVILEHRTRRVFGGAVADRSVDTAGGAIFTRVNCKDYSVELEKKRVAASYADSGTPITQTVGDVFTSIYNDFLSTSGLILGTVEDGPLVEKINFNYVRAIDAFIQLQKLTGGTYLFKVDDFRVLSFRARDAIVAPWSLTDADVQLDVLNDTPSTETSLENYRNRQIVRGGKAETELRTDEFEADGKQKTFVLRNPVASKPVIRVNTIAVSPSAIGIKGVDDDDATKTWLYEIESPNVSAKTAPTSGDDIEIDFIGLFPILVIRERGGEQTTRAANEIGDGIYENLEVDEELDLSTARQFGDALLDKYSPAPERISFTTDRQGEIRAGQLLTVDLDQVGISAQMIIETVNVSMVGDDLRYQVQANDGRELLEWLEFFRRIQRVPFLVRENEKLILGQSLSGQIQFSETVVTALSDARINYDDDEFSAALVGSPIGHRQLDGSADGPHIRDATIV